MRRFFLPAPLRATSIHLLSVIILLAVFFPGCFVGDFISVYFNTYYNAQRLYNEAEGEVWSLPETRMSGKNLLTPFVIGGQTRTKFTQVIEKCSKLLQYHPDSRYVDDALLMIARCYYFQGDYLSAERKCQELMTGYPESSLLLDTRLLLACSRYKSGNLSGALETTKGVIEAATADGDDRVVARASLVEAAVHADQKDFEESRTCYQRAADLGDNREIRVEAILDVADMSARLGQYQAAETAFRRAASESRDYTGEYKGMIGAARMLMRQGEFSDALASLRDLRANANNKEFFGDIGLEIANLYRDMGDYDAALQQYKFVDTTYPRTEVSARSYYQLGLLYETRLLNYDSARVAYNKGRTEYPMALVTPELVRRADYLNRYFQFTSQMWRYDSLRTAILAAPDSTRAMKPDTLRPAPVTPAPPGNPGRTDISDLREREQAESVRRLPPVQLSAAEKDPDSLFAMIGQLEDEMATLFYATIGRTDSALFWYQRVLREYPDGPYIPRVLYTLAQIYAQDSTRSRSSLDSLYREIVRRFPDSDFADESRKLLGLPPEARHYDSASVIYSRSEKLLNSGQGNVAIDTLKSLLTLYPHSPIAPKAEYAVGWIFENVAAQPESAYVYYQKVLKAHPGSVYAMKVVARVNDPDVRTHMISVFQHVDSTAIKPSPVQKDTTAFPGRGLNDEIKPGERRGIKLPPGDRDEVKKIPPEHKKEESPLE